MKKNYLLQPSLFLILFFISFSSVEAQNVDSKSKKIICFAPEIEPNVDEIKDVTYISFFSEITDNVGNSSKLKVLQIENPVEFQKVDLNSIQEMCSNNNSDFAIVPKVKFFKVGLGNYVFSSQVVVSLKVFDASGNLLAETHHDTLKKNMRLLGSAENSIKKGTKGAFKEIMKELRKGNYL